MNRLTFLLVIAFISTSTFAKTVAWVTEIKGNAFIVAGENGPKTLRLGSQIEDLSKVMVEDGSALSVINNQGHELYIPSGSFVKFFSGITELINGEVWVIAKEEKHTGEFNTANATAKYGQGQFIISYDNKTGKTQVLALEGQIKFANNFEANLLIDVPAGFFSFVDAQYENSLPRKPTRVGMKSHSQFKERFAQFEHLRNSDVHQMHWATQKKKQIRSIASVDDQFSMSPVTSKGKIIKITTYEATRTPASISPMQDYTKMQKQERKKYAPQKTNENIKIQYHGFEFKKQTQVKRAVAKEPSQKIVIKTNEVNPQNGASRMPASIPSVSKENLIQELAPGPKSVFEKSLQEKIQLEKRHPSEVNGLIDELKSFKQDYNKNY